MYMFSDDVVLVVFLARIVDRHDVRVLESAHHLGLVEEHLASDARLLLVVLALEVVDLDRDVATVVRVVRQKHAAGAALPDLLDDYVLADAPRHAAARWIRVVLRSSLEHAASRKKVLI